MTQTMAEVLAEHGHMSASKERYCQCGDYVGDWATEAALAAHQAAMLTAAGFGLVQAVRAEVRYEAAAAALDGLRTSAPSDIDAISFMSGFAQEARASVVRGEG